MTTNDLRALLQQQGDTLVLQTAPATISPAALDRYRLVAWQSGAAVVYADPADRPLLTLQLGSLRDDFDFGAIIIISRNALEQYLTQAPQLHYAAFHDFRLYAQRTGTVLHLPEPLYTLHAQADDNQFAYQQASQQAAQQEYEQVTTEHLKHIGAYLPPIDPATSTTWRQALPAEPSETPILQGGTPAPTASVIIPVRNRRSTILDAVASALQQHTDFPYNVIVVDNHSTDGTTAALATINDPRLVVLTPPAHDLQIGGCWNLAVQSQHCGQYAVQLDSDDLYATTATLQTIVDKFRQTHAAAVIGAYQLTDIHCQPLPQGVIAHREWTDTNGHNNALRINGLGAPRAFLTEVLRRTPFPNTSYGEDYATMLAITRRYPIARIYEPIYLCRRWEGNSDANPPYSLTCQRNNYKDTLRTIEILARQRLNS